MVDHGTGGRHGVAPDGSALIDLVTAVSDLLADRSSLGAAADGLADLVATGCGASDVAVWAFSASGPALLAVNHPVLGRSAPELTTDRSFDSIGHVGEPCRSLPIDAAGLSSDDLTIAIEAGISSEIGVRFGGVEKGTGLLTVHGATAHPLLLRTIDEIATSLSHFVGRVDAVETLQACAASYRTLFERAARTAHLADDKRLHWMLDALVLFALVTDVNGDVTFMNTAMLERLGREPDQVLGHGLFADGSEHDEVKQTVQAAIETGQLAPSWINDLTLPDGTTMTVRWTSTFIRDGDGRIDALASVGEDITGRPSSSEEAAESVRMESVGRLAGGIAHDFNNFLTVIGGHTDLARSAPGLSADVAPHLEHIDEATKRATELIRQLLAFGRTEVLEPITISVIAELGELTGLLRPTFRATITIDVVAATDHDLVTFDRATLDQIFVNLAFNARDAMPAGGTLTYVVADETLDQDRADTLGVDTGQYVVVTVTDDGTGIDPAIVDHVFERYVTTKAPGRGSGLGLSTVLGVIRQAGGAITIDADRPTGTRFTLYFRRATGLESGKARPAPACSPPHAPSTRVPEM